MPMMKWNRWSENCSGEIKFLNFETSLSQKNVSKNVSDFKDFQNIFRCLCAIKFLNFETSLSKKMSQILDFRNIFWCSDEIKTEFEISILKLAVVDRTEKNWVSQSIMKGSFRDVSTSKKEIERKTSSGTRKTNGEQCVALTTTTLDHRSHSFHFSTCLTSLTFQIFKSLNLNF